MSRDTENIAKSLYHIEILMEAYLLYVAESALAGHEIAARVGRGEAPETDGMKQAAQRLKERVE